MTRADLARIKMLLRDYIQAELNHDKILRQHDIDSCKRTLARVKESRRVLISSIRAAK